MKCINCGKPADAPHCRECFDERIRELYPKIKEGWKLMRQSDGSFKWAEVWMGISTRTQSEETEC